LTAGYRLGPEHCDQRRLGLCKPTLEGDEGRIVDQRLRQIEGHGTIGPGRHSQREPGKRRHRGGDADIGAERRAAMDVRRYIVRRQAAKSCADLQCLGRRVQHYGCEAGPGRAGGRTSFAPERFATTVIGFAWAVVAGRISAAVNASKQDRSDSFMFASLARRIGHRDLGPVFS
jgi:hypothetical protein